MPVKLKTGYEIGWGLNRTPSDKIFCIYFIDKKTGKELFKYAPKYDDIVFFKHAFRELIRYEFTKLQKLPGKLASNRVYSMGKNERQTNDDICSGNTAESECAKERDNQVLCT